MLLEGHATLQVQLFVHISSCFTTSVEAHSDHNIGIGECGERMAHETTFGGTGLTKANLFLTPFL